MYAFMRSWSFQICLHMHPKSFDAGLTHYLNQWCLIINKISSNHRYCKLSQTRVCFNNNKESPIIKIWEFHNPLIFIMVTHRKGSVSLETGLRYFIVSVYEICTTFKYKYWIDIHFHILWINSHITKNCLLRYLVLPDNYYLLVYQEHLGINHILSYPHRMSACVWGGGPC